VNGRHTDDGLPTYVRDREGMARAVSREGWRGRGWRGGERKKWRKWHFLSSCFFLSPFLSQFLFVPLLKEEIEEEPAGFPTNPPPLPLPSSPQQLTSGCPSLR